MSLARVRGPWLLLGWLLACGGAQHGGAEARARPEPERESSDSTAKAAVTDRAEGEQNTLGANAESAKGAVSAADADPLPKQCATSSELCLPPPGFVKKLCSDAYTGVALRLFDKSSPFARGYVRSREVKAVNTLGGPSSDQSLHFDEEVLILTHSGGPGEHELQVSGMGGYAVLRWDGTCATLGEEELGTRAPRSPKHGPLAWKYIDSNIQNALMRDAGIAAARRQHRQECHGVSLGRISAECARAEAELNQSIVSAVRAGLSLPTPDRMP